MSFTKVIITINGGTDINTFGRLLRSIQLSEAVEEVQFEVD